VTGLDTEALRAALHAGNDPGGAPDLTLIMDRGRRLRRRRLVTAVAGTLCALALLAGAGTGIADLTSSPQAPVQPVSPARPGPHGTHAPTVPPRRTATAGPATPVPVATASPSLASPSPTGSPAGSPAAPMPSKSAPAASPTTTAAPTTVTSRSATSQ